MADNVLVLNGSNGQETVAVLQTEANNGRPGAGAPLGTTDRPSGAAPKGSTDRPGVNTENGSVSERPGVSKDNGNSNLPLRSLGGSSSSTDKLQWYHWVGIAIVIAAIIYGVYRWYKNRQ